MTDVWTSVGVVLGVAAVSLTGWQRLDPIVALMVAANIIREGWHLLRRTVAGLMDSALSPEEQATIRQILAKYRRPEVQFHALRTRQAGARRFISLHVLVPGQWTVHQGHTLLEQIERDLRQALSPNVTVFTHLESLEDQASWQDLSLDREEIV
jgi:cation diffusion facilitator family transporter